MTKQFWKHGWTVPGENSRPASDISTSLSVGFSLSNATSCKQSLTLATVETQELLQIRAAMGHESDFRNANAVFNEGE